MEDAMIINKSSLERGFAHGQIYKSEVSIKHSVSDCYKLLKIAIFKVMISLQLPSRHLLFQIEEWKHKRKV